jgi:hypothetical protein
MPKRKPADMRRWALLGAEQRLLQLAEEAAAIHRAFPELRQKGGSQAGAGRSVGNGQPNGRRRRRKRTMSPEARQRISEAQKKRWAKQRARSSKAGTK